MPEQVLISIRQDTDIVLACRKGRLLAEQVGFSTDSQIAIVTAISEVASNIVKYAGRGEIALHVVRRNGKHGLQVLAQDWGAGIANVEQAMQDGFSTGGSLGLGLPGARRLMDEFEISTQIGQGTQIAMIKWEK